MVNDRIWLLIGRKLAGEASAEELQELEQLLRTHPDIHFPLQTLSDLWSRKSSDTDTELENAYALHLEKMKQAGMEPVHVDTEHPNDTAFLLEGSQKRQHRKTLLFACLTIGILLIAVWWYPSSRKNIKEPQLIRASVSEVSTKFGSKSNIILPDGSEVRLNAGSKLTYDEEFGKTLREVRLTGEAFFDVVKDASKPFIIHASNVDIKVLGTQFNVKSYPGEGTTEAALIRGTIEVSIRSLHHEKIILHPNQKIVVKNDSTDTTDTIATKQVEKSVTEPVFTVEKLTYQPKDSAILETSWVENKLIFQDESFRELAIKMERWYGVSIQFKDRSLENIRLTGTFENETVSQALRALTIVASFHFKIENNNITISK
jgi:ferric-dicitrate binding protein FerR (iron transport regulator)